MVKPQTAFNAFMKAHLINYKQLNPNIEHGAALFQLKEIWVRMNYIAPIDHDKIPSFAQVIKYSPYHNIYSDIDETESD